MAESQDKFLYAPPVDQNLTVRISAPRLEPYLRLMQVNGNFDHAIKWYLWNARLAKAFLFPLQTAEVSVRNSIHNAFSSYLGGSNWIFNPPFSLTKEHQASLSASLRRLSKRKPNPTPDDIVASLSFDFWSNLFREEYEALWMAPGLIAAVFPQAPIGADRDRIKKIVRRINELRNRIAHHEPIYNLRLSTQQYLENIEELVEYICPDTSSWMMNHSTVIKVTRSQPTSSSCFSGPPISSANIRAPLILSGTDTLPKAIRQIKAVRPLVALVPDESKESAYVLVSLADIACYIENVAGQPNDIIDLNEHTLSGVIATYVAPTLSEISIEDSTGDAMAMFFPKGKASSKPEALIVKDTAGAVRGLILKPMIRL